MSWINRFDRVRIVSLTSRIDRRRDMRSELRRLGVISDGHDLTNTREKVSFFDAYRVETPGIFRGAGSHGCYLSHLTILEEAAAAGESVLILQDDCDFTGRLFRAEDLPDCDILYGGFELVGPVDRPHDCDIIGAHCMGFSAKAAARAAEYLPRLLDLRTPPDPRAADVPGFNPAERPPIDGAMVWFRRANPDLVTEFRSLAEQRSSRTDIGTQHMFDRIPVMRNLLGGARRGRRAIRRMLASAAVGGAMMKAATFAELSEPYLRAV